MPNGPILGAAVSNAVMWILTPIVASTNALDMTVSVPVYAASIISTALFTWGAARVVARYDAKREAQIRRLERALEQCRHCGRPRRRDELDETVDDDDEDTPSLFGGD